MKQQPQRRVKIDPDNFEGPANSTHRQLATLIDDVVGGWPAKASWVMMFYHKVNEWVVEPGKPARLMAVEEYEAARKNLMATFQFTDAHGTTLDGTRVLQRPAWQVKLGRDEYYLLRMSSSFTSGLIQQGREEERRRLKSLLT